MQKRAFSTHSLRTVLSVPFFHAHRLSAQVTVADTISADAGNARDVRPMGFDCIRERPQGGASRASHHIGFGAASRSRVPVGCPGPTGEVRLDPALGSDIAGIQKQTAALDADVARGLLNSRVSLGNSGLSIEVSQASIRP